MGVGIPNSTFKQSVLTNTGPDRDVAEDFSGGVLMKTRNLLLPMAMVFAIGAPACTTAQDASAGDLEAVKAQFVGHYELVIYESFRPNGEVVDMNYVGRILYDEHDNMSAIGMPKDLPARAQESSERVQGGFAYWGKVSFDLPNGIVIHHVEGSPTRGSWPGVDNIRYFEFTDEGLLKLSLKNAEGQTTGTLTWRKIES
ncbi:MAG TPA: hypothetical protein DHW20_02220 [Gemmatimonadetes bacterium]|jgi:hypothetical protein|nr:hypothetical protein [Gemmatimonadota bacterium]